MNTAPRFVPTLTEVVRPLLAVAPQLQPTDLLPAKPSVQRPEPSAEPATGAGPAAGAPGKPDPEALLAWIEAEVGESLHRNLHDLIATALVEQIDVVAARLREDIQPMVRRAVLEAVANEAATRTPD